MRFLIGPKHVPPDAHFVVNLHTVFRFHEEATRRNCGLDILIGFPPASWCLPHLDYVSVLHCNGSWLTFSFSFHVRVYSEISFGSGNSEFHFGRGFGLLGRIRRTNVGFDSHEFNSRNKLVILTTYTVESRVSN